MSDTLQTRLSENSAEGQTASADLVIGTYIGFGGDGRPLVRWPGCADNTPVPALATLDFQDVDVGRHVALLFAGGEVARPVVIGLIRQPLDRVLAATQEFASTLGSNGVEDGAMESKAVETAIDASVDDERIVLTANREIVLKCGKSSITLTRAGKIVVRGEYLVSHSSGAHRIRGGSVQIN